MAVNWLLHVWLITFGLSLGCFTEYINLATHLKNLWYKGAKVSQTAEYGHCLEFILRVMLTLQIVFKSEKGIMLSKMKSQ